MKTNRSSNRPSRSIRNILLSAGIAIAAIILVTILGLLFFPDPFINQYVAPQLEASFSTLYPGYSIRIHGVRSNVLKNIISVDSISVRNIDSTESAVVHMLSVNGMSWFPLIVGDQLKGEDLSETVVEMQEIVLANILSQYVVRCGSLHISVPDSLLRAESILVEPETDDESFFSRSPYRQSRYRAHILSLVLTGVSVPDLLVNSEYRSRSVSIHNPSLDILVNKDKLDKPDTSFYVMPNEMLAALKARLQVDSLRITNADVIYGERFGVRKKPASITIDNLQILALGIATMKKIPLTIQAQGMFMKTGAMNILIAFPPVTPDFSFRYSGTLGPMNIEALNGFLETAEQVRVHGAIRSAAFDVTVRSGRARGIVRAEYSGLRFAFIDSNTGSEKGIGNLISSFIANTFAIRKNNVADKSGVVAIGTVSHTRTYDDPFFRFIWFSLRSGIRDVVGF